MAGTIDREDATRISEFAWTAGEYVRAIMREANKEYCFAYYVLDKAEEARRCLETIIETAKEYKNKQEAAE